MTLTETKDPEVKRRIRKLLAVFENDGGIVAPVLTQLGILRG